MAHLNVALISCTVATLSGIDKAVFLMKMAPLAWTLTPGTQKEEVSDMTMVFAYASFVKDSHSTNKRRGNEPTFECVRHFNIIHKMLDA
jgi:hypothetical protein